MTLQDLHRHCQAVRSIARQLHERFDRPVTISKELTHAALCAAAFLGYHDAYALLSGIVGAGIVAGLLLIGTRH